MEFRSRFLGDIIGIVTILVIIILFVAGTLIFFNVPQRMRGSLYNEGPAGVSLFVGWLDERGYEIRTLESETDYITSQDAMLFVLAPRSEFSSQDLWRLDGWVQRGGTLVIAQDSRQPSNLPGRFGVGINRLFTPVEETALALPTLNWPPVGWANIEASHYISNACGRLAVHMGSCQRPLLVGSGRGLGRVFIISTSHPFTNEGIENDGNAQLVENMVLAATSPGQRIVFDEIHHQISLTWMFTTPTGIAFWLSLLALFAFVFWQNSYVPSGRAKKRMGQTALTEPVAKPVNNLEGAYRQFARPEAIKIHYWQRLKRVMARRYGVDPTQDDAGFIDSLKPLAPDEDLGTIVYLASQKEKFPPMSDYELRQWVTVIVDLTDSHDLRKLHQFFEILARST